MFLRTSCKCANTYFGPLFVKTEEAGDVARKITGTLQIPRCVSAGGQAALSVGKNIPFIPPPARCTLAESAGIGNKPK